MSADPLLVEREGALAILTLNRPDRLNAMDARMTRELPAAMLGLISDEAVRAIMLTGAGRAFCAGTDLHEAAAGLAGSSERGGDALRDHLNPMIWAMRRAAKPILAVVNGPAAGVGCSLALAADVVIAGRSASFIQSFVRVGAVPDAGSTWLLPRIVGARRATAMMLLGRPVSAEVALAWGLVDGVHPDDQLEEAGMLLGREIAHGPTLAYALLKRCLAESPTSGFQEQLDREAEAQDAAFSSRDRAEGFEAFAQGRPAAFEGR